MPCLDVCVKLWICAMATVSTVALGVIAGVSAWQADSVHVMKHAVGGDPTVRLHYSQPNNWVAYPFTYCIHDGPEWMGGHGGECTRRSPDEHEWTADEVMAFAHKFTTSLAYFSELPANQTYRPHGFS